MEEEEEVIVLWKEEESGGAEEQEWMSVTAASIDGRTGKPVKEEEARNEERSQAKEEKRMKH